ncbi:CHAT domain-containing protein [Denitromonas ohlonensis]|uniref:CHAT domain-containing protein n=2 Tax=Denitromonas TaxID=139331 RepID=A0A557RT79_9RHOO|nr:CHAT domain-containing protein [Denitromonas ohlonensis]TVO68366.1 CHAT domain-containing protein [Denitromonas ohlonensis]TVO74644.1 CHAT domain-containing protein [Denitromonas ohlonensis]
MNIFLSYASDYREIADDMCCRLQAAGHEVFFDREDLPAGASFDDRIREAIDACELFIFLVSPAAVADGHYTRTELKIVSRKWPTPGWHVLPVVVAPTPLDTIPAYLRALTLMQAEGNLTAEVVLEVQERVRRHTAPDDTPAAPPKADPGGVRYQSVQLRFSLDGAGSYTLAVPASPAGEQPATHLPLDTAALEHGLWQAAQPIAGSTRRAVSDATVDALLPAGANARQIGQQLYAALFDSPLRTCLEENLRSVDPQRGNGLRFVINTTDAPELARLPWEFLYSPAKDDFLFSDRMLPVVRWLDVDAATPTLTVEPPLRLLIAIAAPSDRPGLEVGEEIAHLDTALAELTERGVMQTVRLDHATLERLDNALLEHRPHVLHFIGHGDFVDDEGVLVLESDTAPGTADTIAGRQLAVLLRNHLTSLRLVFLNSCMGATASARDPFGGMAQSLIRRGIPAVIAMQFPVPDGAAVAMARHFYRYLAAGQPVDAALTSTRAFLYARGYAVEWGAPALHMRTPDGRLFDLAPAPPGRAADPMVASQTPPAATPPPVPPIAAAPAASGSSGARIGMVIGVVLLLGGGAWLALQSGEDSAPTPVNMAPAPAPVPAPTDPIVVLPPDPPPQPEPIPEPAPVGVAPTPPSPPATVDPAIIPPPPPAPVGPTALPSPAPTGTAALALKHLRAGDAMGGTALLSQALDQDPAALSLDRLGRQAHAELADALARTAEQGFATGDVDGAQMALSALDAMAPFDPALEAALMQRLAPWLAMAAPAAGIEPAAGPSDEGGPMRYTVRRGDTLWRIARRLTGDGRNWREMVAYNNRLAELGMGGQVIADPHRIEPGQVISVPDILELRAGGTAYRITGDNPLQHLPPHLNNLAVGRGRAMEYHVSPGESLSRIAARIYGDPALWRDIQRDNATLIRDPDRIYPGQILVLPPRPAAR